MGVQNLGFRDLKYVIAVAESSSISRAAEACGITQPALSERIKRIEATLGVELFERSRRVIKMTPVGERLVRKARELLDETADFDEIISTSHEPLGGQLRVGVITTLGPYLMPLLLPRLRKAHPNLELILHEGLTDTLISTLQAGSLDLVIAAAPIGVTGLDEANLFDEPFVLAVPADHDLATRKTVAASDLCGNDMVLLQDGHCLTGQALDICPAKQRQSRNRLHATTLETLRHMVATGAGYTLLPALAVGGNPPLEDLIRYRNLGGKRQYGRKIVLTWRHSFGRQKDIDLFSDLIRRSVPAKYRL